ncbi:ATP-binding protein [uncultured Brachyspira sp.]|uniref:ATP-binding protein n=1 Tax=uncultured Brachyspira sp. TaxID=221953 RepID=UPI0026156531|nr:ATP-binding protein [uncultured Brachyspira sp.]
MIKTINCSEKDFEIIPNKDLVLFKINKIMSDKNYTHRESMENVFSSLKYQNDTFVYIMTCEYQKINIHLGVLKDKNNDIDSGSLLRSSFLGNFYGSSLKKVTEDELSNFYSSMKKYKRFGVVDGVPSINSSKKEYGTDVDFQGIDRLINASINMRWRIIILFTPVEYDKIKDIEKNICNYYEKIYKDYKVNYQHQDNSSTTTTTGKNNSVSNAIAKVKGWSETETKGNNTQSSSSKTSKSESISEGKNGSTTETTTTSKGDNDSTAKQTGESSGTSYERINRTYKKEMDYIDEFLLDRIQRLASRGYYKTNTYIMAYNKEDLITIESLYCSIFHGDSNTYNTLNPYILNLHRQEEVNNNDILFFNHLSVKHNDSYSPLMSTLEKDFGVASFLTASELSIIAGIPISEVPNLVQSEYVEFGLNVKDSPNSDCFSIGHLVNKEAVLESIDIKLDKKILNKHIFIAGVTGSGKTTTCQKILLESNLPFMVIEPTKTEYRELAGKFYEDDIMIFTVGNELNSPFRFNPFEILEGENIISHIDMLKAAFINSFHMEASMPQLLEEAIYKVYEHYGWNFETNKNRYTENPYSENGLYFPIISDFIVVLGEIVNTKGFDTRLKNDYIGSLVSRFSNLCIGSKGAILNTRRSIDVMTLIDKKVILELEDLKSGDDKALLMSLMISRIAEAIKIRYKKDPNFKHITLIEEAHRLLTKVDSYDSMGKKEAVNVFSDLLAEIRKYGESLIIADQIPNKIIPEVLKNTNTKIIHKLFAKDDKESVGNAMMMDDKQKEYLSNLKPGEAVLFSESVDKPVHIKIKAVTDTSSVVSENKIINIFNKTKNRFDFELSNAAPCNMGKISYRQIIDIDIKTITDKFNNLLKKVSSNIIKKDDQDRNTALKNDIDSFYDYVNNIAIEYNIELKILFDELLFRYFDISGRRMYNKFNIQYKLLENFINVMLTKNYNDIDNFDIMLDKYNFIECKEYF